jgi:exosortase A
LLTLLLAELLFYRETAMAMVTIWARSDTFMHGFLILPISLWLVWREREVLADMQPAPNPWFALGIAASGFVWLLGQIVTVAPVSQFALIGILVSTVAAILGARISLAMGFPLAFLLFAPPFGEFFLPQLMQWTADFTVLGLRFSGIPVYREGLQFVIPSGAWSVVEACSGVRYLIASLVLGTLFAYLNYRSLKRRLAFIAVSFVVPILANWLRAYIIVMLGHLSGNVLATGVDHLIYGWLFFGVVIFLMFAIGGRWADRPHSGKRIEHIQQSQDCQKNLAAPVSSFLKIAGIVMLILVLAPLGEWYLLQRRVAALPVFPDMTQLENGWQSGGRMSGPEWKPAYGNPSAEQNKIYSARNQTVGMYIAYYRQQGYDRKLISSENMLVRSNDHVWAQVASEVVDRQFSSQLVPMRSAELRAGGVDSTNSELQRLVVRQFFWINGFLTASDVRAKLLTAFTLLCGRGDDSAVIILYAPKNQDNGGEAALTAFVEANSTRILNTLDEMRTKP